MYALATCRGDILRGTTEDDYGDVVDATTVVASGVLASLRETASRVYDRTTQTARVVRTTTALFPSGTDLQVSDRFRDSNSGILYWVENVSNISGPGFRSDTLAELRRVT